jgi:protein TonB
MASANQHGGGDRIKAGLGVAAFHLLVGHAFLTGLGVDVVSQAGADRLKVFDVPAPLPPPTPENRLAATGAVHAPSPPAVTSKATPVVTPAPEIRLDRSQTIVTAPLQTPAVGSDRSTGASLTDGVGTGAGGEGGGAGSGGQGSGIGGGSVVRARRVSGSLSGASDYPPAARRGGMEGSVAVRFTVELDGSVSGCRVIRSTAGPELDVTTCRLIERRFRYEPAQDQAGRPVRELVSRTFDWMLPFRR